MAAIDPGLADTAAFCERYEVGLDESANCVVVTGRRDGQDRYAAAAGPIVIGSGVRRSKLVLPGAALASLPGAVVIEGLGR